MMNEKDNLEGYKLDDNEIKNVAGGAGVQYMEIACPNCGTINRINISQDTYECKKCNKAGRILG